MAGARGYGSSRFAHRGWARGPVCWDGLLSAHERSSWAAGLRYAELRLHDAGYRLSVYTGREFSGGPVTVVLLAGEAASDRSLRQAFATAVGARRAGGDEAAAVHACDVHAERPWAAIRGHPGDAGVDWLLFELTGALAPAPAGAVPPSVEPAGANPAAAPGGGGAAMPDVARRPAAGGGRRDHTGTMLIVAAATVALCLLACCGYNLVGGLLSSPPF